MLEKLMDNPYAWAILAICTVVSLPLGLYSIVKGKKYKAFSFSHISNSIVRNGEKLIPQIKFTFNNLEIHNLTVTKVAIWSSGNEVINSADIVVGKELNVIVPDGVEILSAEIIGKSDETNQFSLVKMDPQVASLAFNYVEKNDGIVVQVIHTGFSDDISVSCKIKGGKPVKDANPNLKEPRFLARVNPIKFMAVASAVLSGIITLMNIVSVLALFIPSLFDYLNTPMILNYEQHLVLTIFVTVMTVIVNFMSGKMLKQAFRLPIPIKLRKFM